MSVLPAAPQKPGCQILLVDDSQLTRGALRDLLLACNPTWEIHEADTGAKALEKGLEVRPDLILLDLNLPDIPSSEAVRKIKQISPAAKLLLCSFSDESSLAFLTNRLGADAYFAKTSSPDELCNTVTALLAAKK